MADTPKTCPKCGSATCRMIDTGYAMRDVTVCWETECQQRQLDQLRAENERLAARVELLCQKIWG